MNIPFPLDNMYEVTDNQEIYSHYWKRILSTERKTYTFNNQYKKWYCAGTKKDYLLHRTVALVNNIITIDEFKDRNVLVNHKDGIKTNNIPSNLEKVTYSGNLLHYHKLKHTAEYLSRKYTLDVLTQALNLKKGIV